MYNRFSYDIAWRSVLLLVAGILFVGCDQADSLIISDEFFEAFDWATPNASKEITGVLDAAGWKPEIHFVELGARIPDLSEEIQQKLQGKSIVLLSPVLSYQGPQLASLFPTLKIITLGTYDYADSYPDLPNLCSIYSRRSQAFHDAGKLLGIFLSETTLQSVIESEEENMKETAVEAYFYVGNRDSRMEMTAFKEGLEETDAIEYVEYIEIDTLASKQNIKNRIDGSVKRHTPFLLFFLGELNAFCIESVLGEDVNVVSDSVRTSEAFSELILFSIEEDRAKAILAVAGAPTFYRTTIPDESDIGSWTRSYAVESNIYIPQDDSFLTLTSIAEGENIPFVPEAISGSGKSTLFGNIKEFLGIR